MRLVLTRPEVGEAYSKLVLMASTSRPSACHLIWISLLLKRIPSHAEWLHTKALQVYDELVSRMRADLAYHKSITELPQ